MADSLYERLGGETAVLAAVTVFYDKVMGDPLTRPFFDGVDMKIQVRKQISFMAWAFGDAANYKGRSLRDAHASLVKSGLNDVHFDAVATHLQETLAELDVEPELITEVMDIVGPTRSEVLGR